MKKLAMAPTQLRARVLSLIERERRRAESGQAAEISAKMNSLVDEDLIRALYEASRAGVRIRLNVRGICCLRPGVKGVSENIRVTSIVGRFLEHGRIYYFHNGGDEEVYLGSADLMPRNFDHRVEVLFPVLDPRLKRRVIDDVMEVHLADNVKAREMRSDGTYQRVAPKRGATHINSQQRMLDQRARRAPPQDGRTKRRERGEERP